MRNTTTTMTNNKIICGDAIQKLKELEPESVQMCFTCPTPLTPAAISNPNDIYDYSNWLMDLFTQVRRVLKPNGSLFFMMPDYHTDNNRLLMMPERIVSALLSSNEKWVLKSKLIWHRSETKDSLNRWHKYADKTRFIRDWEYIFFLTKDPVNHYINPQAIHLFSRSVLSYPYREPREGVFESGLPGEIIGTVIQATTKKGDDDVVLDPLAGTGTTGLMARKLGRGYIMIDIDPWKCEQMEKRLAASITTADVVV